MTIKVRMLFDKETSGAVRFAEVDDQERRLEMFEAQIGNLYLRKIALPKGADGKRVIPELITVNVDLN